MNGVVFKESGSWMEKLELTTISIGEPGECEVQVKIMARPVNPSDEMFINGVYRHKPVFPQVSGLEGAGIIEKVGRKADAPLIGKHIAFRARGTWADKINLQGNQFRIVPDAIPFEIASQLSLNTLTAYALLDQSSLAPGQWLLITAANSSVSRQVIQLARALSINVIAIVRKEEHKEVLRKLGATEVINSETDDIEAVVKGHTNNGANAILDAVGGALGSTLFNIAAPFSKILIYGRLSSDDVKFSYGNVIYKNLKIEGFGIDNWINNKTEDELNSIWQRIGYDKIYELKDFNEAIADYKKTGSRIIMR